MKFIKLIKSNIKVNAAVKDLPQDLIDAINKHAEGNFTEAMKELYRRTHKDLNKMELSNDAITTTSKVRTSDFESEDKAFFILIDDKSLVLLCGGHYPYLLGGPEYFEINGRNVDVSYSPMNVARVLNNYPYKAWVIDLSKAESTEKLREDRQDSQKNTWQRNREIVKNPKYDTWYSDRYDLSGYEIDKNRLKNKLRKLRQESNAYTNQLIELYSKLSVIFNKRMLLPIDKRTSTWELRDAFKSFATAVEDAENNYKDPRDIQRSIDNAKINIEKLEK